MSENKTAVVPGGLNSMGAAEGGANWTASLGAPKGPPSSIVTTPMCVVEGKNYYERPRNVTKVSWLP